MTEIPPRWSGLLLEQASSIATRNTVSSSTIGTSTATTRQTTSSRATGNGTQTGRCLECADSQSRTARKHLRDSMILAKLCAQMRTKPHKIPQKSTTRARARARVPSQGKARARPRPPPNNPTTSTLTPRRTFPKAWLPCSTRTSCWTRSGRLRARASSGKPPRRSRASRKPNAARWLLQPGECWTGCARRSGMGQ